MNSFFIKTSQNIAIRMTFTGDKLTSSIWLNFCGMCAMKNMFQNFHKEYYSKWILLFSFTIHFYLEIIKLFQVKYFQMHLVTFNTVTIFH